KYKEVLFYPESVFINSLSRIFGIGKTLASYITDMFGFSRSLKTSFVTRFHFSRIVVILKFRLVLDVRLKELHLQRLEFFFSYSFVKGFRLFDGLPIHGRTHSNGSTAFRLKPFSEKLNEQILSRQRRILLYSKRKIKKHKGKRNR